MTDEQRRKFPPLCPDFLIEIRSPSDNLDRLKKKMQEYIDHGCRQAWLIDREAEQVFMYRANGAVSLAEDFKEVLSGEDVLPGFELLPARPGT